jgi:hypothetical protein
VFLNSLSVWREGTDLANDGSFCVYEGFPDEFILKPTQCLFSSDRADVAARFPDAPDEQIDVLVNDYRQESDVLRRGLEEFDLDGYFKEVVRLQSEYSEGRDTAMEAEAMAMGDEGGGGEEGVGSEPDYDILEIDED